MDRSHARARRPRDSRRDAGATRQPRAIRRHPNRTESPPAHFADNGLSKPKFIQGEKKMTTGTLQGKKVAILVTDGFEQVELTEPRKALDEAGAATKLVSPAGKKVKGWNHKEWGKEISVDVPLDSAKADEFDALLLPGGVMNPDNLRMIPKAVEFVKQFTDSGKPVAAICHGPWTLIEAGAVRGRTMTSWPSLKTDLKNAGATWVDKEVVNDNGIVTSRKPDDIPAFNREMIRLFGEGRGQTLRKTA
jgi:protease I